MARTTAPSATLFMKAHKLPLPWFRAFSLCRQRVGFIERKPLLISVLVFALLCSALTYTYNIQAQAAVSDLQVNYLPSFSGQMCGSAFTKNGTLFVGDNNYNLFRSDDYGATFRFVKNFPVQPNPNSAVTGYVWNIFVDSRNNVFVSIPSTNRLYRSTNFGASFSQVLNTNTPQNDGFFIAMTEDSQGNLYAATYSNSVYPNNPPLYKSTNGGSSWTIIHRFSTIHLHNVKFNPADGYLYVNTGEWTQGYNNQECERVFRSKDYGQTWSIVVNRPVEIQAEGNTVYLPMLFSGRYVYLGTDQAFQPNWIDRFYDDGSTTAFTPQTVYSFPGDCDFPVCSAVWLNSEMIFSNTAEFFDGTSRVVASSDGVNWQIIKEIGIPQSLHHTNFLTINPKGILFGSDGPGRTFSISEKLQPPPTPTPTPPPNPTPTPTPPPGGIVFQDSFESGSFSAWTTNSGAGTHTQTVETSNPYNGRYDAKFTAGASSEAWAQKSFSSSYPVLYLQQYIKLASLPASGTRLYLGTIQNTNSNNNVDVFIENSGGQYYWGAYTSINGNEYFDRESAPSNPHTGVYYCVETCRDAANSRSKLWVDGNLKVDASRPHVGYANNVYAGISYASNAATVYVDYVKASTAYMDPQPPQPTPTPTPTATPTPKPTATPTPSPSPTPTPTPKPTPTPTPSPSPTTIFSDGFESGNYNSWTKTLSVGSKVTQSVQSANAYQGTYADQVSVADGAGENGICIYKDLGASYTSIAARVYMRLSAKPAVGSVLEVFGFSRDGWLPNAVGTRVDVVNNNGILQWRLDYYSNGWRSAYAGPINPNTWYSVEVKLVIGSGGTGETRLYVNGAEALTQTGLTNTAPGTSVRYFSLGVDDEMGNNALNVYFDSTVLANSYIGP